MCSLEIKVATTEQTKVRTVRMVRTKMAKDLAASDGEILHWPKPTVTETPARCAGEGANQVENLKN